MATQQYSHSLTRESISLNPRRDLRVSQACERVRLGLRPTTEAMPPQTRYARRGDLRIAYQLEGDGPLDLVWVPGFISRLELNWTIPEVTALIRRLASFSRL